MYYHAGMGTRALLLGVATLACVGSRVAQAQETVPEEEELYIPELRSPGRPIIGAGFGIGTFDALCNNCASKNGFAIEAYGGWQFHRRVAVLADATWTIDLLPVDGDNRGIVGDLALSVAAQVWITPQLYLRGGVGAGGLAAIAEVGSGIALGPGVILGVGGELGHRPDHGIDLSLRGAGSSIGTSDRGDFLLVSAAALVSYHHN